MTPQPEMCGLLPSSAPNRTAEAREAARLTFSFTPPALHTEASAHPWAAGGAVSLGGWATSIVSFSSSRSIRRPPSPQPHHLWG